MTLGWFVEALGFAYGILLEDKLEDIKRIFCKEKRGAMILLTLASGAFGIAYMRYKPVPVAGDYILKIALGIALILFVLCVTANFSPKNKVSTWLGLHSFEIYLYHGFVMSVLDWLNGEFDIGIQSGIFTLLTFVLTFFLAIPMRAINNRIIKKLKAV